MGLLSGATPLSAIIVSFDSAEHLPALLRALSDDPAGPAQVIVVDNASSDGSADIAAAAGATVMRMDTNTGYAAGCHAGVAAAEYDTFVFLNPDTLPQSGWMPPLIAALDAPDVAAASPTIELPDKPGHFMTSGGALAYYGVAWATDIGVPVDGASHPVETAFPSGAAMAITADRWRQLGGFRPELFMYHEDADLGWRSRLQGLRSVRVPQSVVAHDYDFARNPDKMFYLERNRLMLLRANYRTATLLLLAPVLVAVELGIFIIAIRDGWAGTKARTWRAAYQARRQTTEWRHALTRTVSDGAMLATMESSPAGASQVQVPAARFVGWLLGGYQKLVGLVLR